LNNNGDTMQLRQIAAALMALALHTMPMPAAAQDKAVVDALESYMDFVDYGGATIFPEQIPREDWSKFFVIDARDKDQFAKEHIPGAVNIEWRRTVAERSRCWCIATPARCPRSQAWRCAWLAMTTYVFCKAVLPSGKPRAAWMLPPKQPVQCTTDRGKVWNL
jgi:hypothetical protein